MADASVEIVRASWEAALREDWDAAVASLHPEAEIRDHDIPDADPYRGHDGYFAWLRRWSESWDRWQVEELEVRPAGEDGAIALFVLTARGRGSGVELVRRDALTCRLAEGMMVRLDYYNDQDEALRAMGL